MKQHTSEFKKNLIDLGRDVDNIIIYGNTTLHDELYKASVVYEGNVLKSVMKELDIESSVDIPKETIINYKMGIKVDNAYEYLDYGNFVVFSSERQEDKRNYKIVAYDKMLYSMKDYEDLEVQYPITIRDYIIALCNKLDLEFANEDDEFANYDRQILTERYLDADGNSLDYTYRDVLDELAQVTASTICINKDDKLEIRYIDEIPVDTNQASGTNIEIDDGMEHKIAGAEFEAVDTTQETTEGKNLLSPTQSFSNQVSGVVYTGNKGKYTIKGKGTGSGSTTNWAIANYTIKDRDFLHLKNTGTINGNLALVFTCSDNTTFSYSPNALDRIVQLNQHIGKTITKMGFYQNGNISGVTVDITMTPMIVNDIGSTTTYEKYTRG